MVLVKVIKGYECGNCLVYHQNKKDAEECCEEMFANSQQSETDICEGCNKAVKNLNPCQNCGFKNLGFANSIKEEQKK